MTDIIEQLKAEDIILNERMATVQGDSRKMLELLMERHKNYHRHENQATDPTLRVQISNMREDVFLQIMIYKIKADFEDDIAKIISRIDDLETKVKNLSQGK